MKVRELREHLAELPDEREVGLLVVRPRAKVYEDLAGQVADHSPELELIFEALAKDAEGLEELGDVTLTFELKGVPHQVTERQDLGTGRPPAVVIS